MLQISNLTKSYGTQVLLDAVSFNLNGGERAGLVGRNGHGKTTLFRLILGEEHADNGSISVPAGYTIGHLSQHIDFSEQTVIAEACLGLPQNNDGRDESFKAKAILSGLGFTEEDFLRHPSEFSGGFQVRLSLAKVLVSEPDLLLLDEPTNYLDILSIRWLTRFLRNWKGELIIITHDRRFMDSVTTHTILIHRCKVRKIEGPTGKLYEQIAMEEELYERTRQNDEKKRRETEEFINRFRAKATKASAVQSRVKALNKMERLEKLGDIQDLDFSFRSAPFAGKWLMNVEDLCFGFTSGGPRLIDGLTFAVGKQDRIAVIGKNGKGKTTLLNLLTKELSPKSGEVRLHDSLRPAYFGQTNIARLNPTKTVVQEIMDASPELGQTAARSLCGLMMFEGDNALKKVSVLSGGEKSRVLLGKLLVSPANLLLLDEPTNHLDMQSVESLVEALVGFDGAVIIVTHSEMVLEALANRLIVFDNGKVSLFEGTYREFLDRVGWSDEPSPQAQSAKSAPVAAINTNRKDLRRQRADIVAERSKALTPLQKKIETLEKDIMRVEQQMEQDTQAIAAASQKSAALAIRDLSRSMHEGRQKIETLFAELETVTAVHDGRAKEFDERMNGMMAEA
ncbi:MAG TPA: ABC transporter ATP-binding protein [Nitrospiraceae bacterium]|nr:ABC transporter ATP-binding protein [Nitrospiraceae bacterium]